MLFPTSHQAISIELNQIVYFFVAAAAARDRFGTTFQLLFQEPAVNALRSKESRWT